MLTNSSNIQIRQASGKLAPTKSASATMAILLFVLSAQLNAGQNGRGYGSGSGTDRSSARPNYGASSARPQGSSHTTATANRPTGVPSHMATPSLVNHGGNRPSTSPSPSPASMPGHSGKSFTPGTGSGYQGLKSPNGQGSSNAGWNHRPNATPNGTHVTNITNTYVNKYTGHGRGPDSSIDRIDRGTHGRYISDTHFRSNFGREHEFHVNRQVLLAGHRRFQFGGVMFGVNQPWPGLARNRCRVRRLRRRFLHAL